MGCPSETSMKVGRNSTTEKSVVYVFSIQMMKLFNATGIRWQWFQTKSGTIVATGILIICSVLLYLYRTYHRDLYGLFEFGIAVVSGWAALGEFFTQGLSAWLVVISSLYFMIRGLDNFFIGM